MLRLLLLFILIVIIARAFWRLVDGVLAGARDGRSVDSRKHATRNIQMARDPVCGTFVVPERAITLEDGSSQWYFCSTRCRDTFRARPSADRDSSEPVGGRPA